MKHFKILTACFALLFSLTLTAQSSEVNTQKDLVASSAEKYTAEMVEALGMQDEARIRTVQMMNENYELAVSKTKMKNNSEDDLKKVLHLLDENRTKRFQGILTPEQFDQYMIWKRTH